MKFSVTSRNTLLRFLALFVAKFDSVTPMVDNLRDVRPPRRGEARRMLIFYEVAWIGLHGYRGAGRLSRRCEDPKEDA
jgi:hypothetical protein